eukprot:27286_4
MSCRNFAIRYRVQGNGMKGRVCQGGMGCNLKCAIHLFVEEDQVGYKCRGLAGRKQEAAEGSRLRQGCEKLAVLGAGGLCQEHAIFSTACRRAPQGNARSTLEAGDEGLRYIQNGRLFHFWGYACSAAQIRCSNRSCNQGAWNKAVAETRCYMEGTEFNLPARQRKSSLHVVCRDCDGGARQLYASSEPVCLKVCPRKRFPRGPDLAEETWHGKRSENLEGCPGQVGQSPVYFHWVSHSCAAARRFQALRRYRCAVEGAHEGGCNCCVGLSRGIRQSRRDACGSKVREGAQRLPRNETLGLPRFYFVADADLLDILSKGSNPQLILKHMPKCFDNIKTLEFNKDDNGVPTKVAIGMYSQEQEYVAWPNTFSCEGAVETWLYGLTNHTHDSLIIRCNECVSAFDDKPREQFIFDWCAQLVSVICRIVYTEDVNRSFERLEEGDENAMRDYNRKQIDVLNKYAELILTDLQSNDRKKIIMLMTLDVHARDITQQLIDQKLETKDVFAWMSQLKFRTDDKTNVVAIDICDYTCF